MSWGANYVETPAISLGGTSDPVHMFLSWMVMAEYGDGGNVQISTNGGDSWSVLEVTGMAPRYHYSTQGKRVWTGNHTPWSNWSIPLSEYIGLSIRLRFSVYSNYSTDNLPGWYVDDVMIVDPET